MKRIILFAGALALCAAPAAAQEELLTACSNMNLDFNQPPFPGYEDERDNAERQARFLCGQVVNAMTNVQPGIGIAFSGGNPVLGTATTIGRRLGLFPRISVTARVNGAFAEVPELLDGYTGELGSDGQLPGMETSGIAIGSFQGDAAIGLFNGFSLGPTLGGLGAIDLLGSVSFIPAVDETGLEENIVNWGAGARIGILKQGLIIPGLSVSGMYRNMSEQSFGSIADGDPAEFSSDLRTISLRAAVSKGLMAFDFAAGAGYDIYSSDVRFDWRLTCPAGECGPTQVTVEPEVPIEGELESAAWNVFGNVGLSLLVLNVVGEVGYQKATEVITAEDLAEAGLPNQQPTVDELDGGRLFASLGVRLTF